MVLLTLASGHTMREELKQWMLQICTEIGQNTASATFDLTGWELEVGDGQTPFEHEDIGTTLRKCQTYYFRSSQNWLYNIHDSIYDEV